MNQRHQKIRQIVNREFDVEILHKWREIRILEDELDKGLQLQALLEKLLLNGNNVIIMDISYLIFLPEHVYAGSMDRSSSFAISQPVSRINTPAPSSGTSSVMEVDSPKRIRQASMQVRLDSGVGFDKPTSNEPGPLFELCPDGSVVRLRCPVCSADRFRSVLGLVNHCRINCGLLVSNPEDRIQKCGIPVSRDEIPPDYFVTRGVGQLKRERDLAQIRAGVQGPIVDSSRRPTVREFSETDTTIQIPLSARGSRSGSNQGSNQVLSSIASQQADVQDLQSRFYIRKRVIIGNYARSLDSGLDEAEASRKQIPTHEWRLYLRPFDPHDDISSYVKAVRFHLHPSYKPNDVVRVEEKPFELAMTGWGEFPALLEVIFTDPKNKPVEFVHFIRLRPCNSRSLQLMSEQAYDIELDKRTAMSKRLLEVENMDESSGAVYSVDDALAMASRFFPLFGSLPKQAPPSSAGYNRAVSYSEFMKLSVFDQQTLEKERAVALQRHLLTAHPDLTVDYVLDWCRSSGLSPVIVPSVDQEQSDSGADGNKDQVGITTSELKSLQYCRYCGLAHFPQDKFDVLQKNCSMRPRKLHLSSRSTASELVASFVVSAEPIPEIKRSRVIESYEMEPSEPPVDTWSEEEQWTNQAVASLELPSYQPRRDTCSLLATVTKRFLGDLMAKAAERLPDTIERTVGRPAILTPVHLYQAITGLVPVSAVSSSTSKDKDKEKTAEEQPPSAPREPNKFDFLSSSFMAGT